MESIAMRWTICGLCFVAVAGCNSKRRPAAGQPIAVAQVVNQSSGANQSKKISANKTEAAKIVPVKSAQTPPKSEGQRWALKGWGQTLELAETHALGNGRQKMADYLMGLDPPVKWLPDNEYIRKNIMSALPEKCAESENQKVNGELVPCWSWTFTLLPAQVEFFRQEEMREAVLKARQLREGVAEERMVDLGKYVGVAVMALCGFWLLLHRATNSESAKLGRD